jgi:hypothetical protein
MHEEKKALQTIYRCIMDILLRLEKQFKIFVSTYCISKAKKYIINFNISALLVPISTAPRKRFSGAKIDFRVTCFLKINCFSKCEGISTTVSRIKKSCDTLLLHMTELIIGRGWRRG